MKGDTNCAECGSAYRPHEKYAKNAKKQWNDNAMTQIKDVVKEILPTLPEAAQEKLKTSFRGLPAARGPKADLLGATAEASPDGQEDRETGQVAAQSCIKADTDFEKFLDLKQEHQKLKQEMAAPDFTSSTENMVLPQPEAVTDEATKAELNALLVQEQALQESRRRLALNFAAKPTQAKRISLNDEDDVDLTEKPPGEMEQPTKAPKTGDTDKKLFSSVGKS